MQLLLIIKNKEHLNKDRKGLEQLLVKKTKKKIWINTVMRQARSILDRKRRSEPSSSFITISLSFVHPSLGNKAS